MHQRLKQPLLCLALAFILGGAIGNLCDRSFYGFVIDFIYVHYEAYYWPAFNVADSFISTGVALILYDAFKNKKPLLELTYNWDAEEYKGGRNFGHLAFNVNNIYEKCQFLTDNGVTINRPPRDGYMAFIKSPDGISLELLQKGDPLEIKEPWSSMNNEGTW